MLKAWTSWLEWQTGAAQNWPALAPGQWLVSDPNMREGSLFGDVEELSRWLDSDPILRSIDQIWNANPLHDLVPLDWAEIARALRTVWLHSITQPAAAMASVTEFNQ